MDVDGSPAPGEAAGVPGTPKQPRTPGTPGKRSRRAGGESTPKRARRVVGARAETRKEEFEFAHGMVMEQRGAEPSVDLAVYQTHLNREVETADYVRFSEDEVRDQLRRLASEGRITFEEEEGEDLDLIVWN